MQTIESMKQLMGQATQLVRSGKLADATRAIQEALGNKPHGGSSVDSAPQHAPGEQAGRRPIASDVEDAVIVERSTTPPDTDGDTALAGEPTAPVSPAAAPAVHPDAEAPGTFTRVAFSHGPGAAVHHYHLYVPPGAQQGAPLPLVMMLHGCTQNPEDFARGTGMNDAAASSPALVLYPEQPHSANAHGCWNWFRPSDQRRGSGEPALLMAMLRDVMQRHAVDERRVYVAGLSAGGAMAAVLAREYPDVFAAAGVHSGLSAGAAHNVMTAMSAMKNGAKPHARSTRVAAPGERVVPVIVFHGDADATVNAHNGDQVVAAALGAAGAGVAAMVRQVDQGRGARGQAYTRTIFRSTGTGAAGPVVAEQWVLHGAGHAWAGGRAGASHTDPNGVDATGEMLRFFLEHSQ